jgi:TPR repeat protein
MRCVSGSLTIWISILQPTLAAAQAIKPSDIIRAKREGKPLPLPKFPPAPTGTDAKSLRARLDFECGSADFSQRQQRCRDLTVQAAQAGDAKAMAELGWRYLVRETAGQPFQFQVGVVANDATALSWIQRAVEQGSPDGMAYLGWMYLVGQGVQRDLTQAQLWLRRAADARVPRAMAMIGAMELFGETRTGGGGTGEQWLRRAAEAGDRRALTLLALLLIQRGGSAIAQENPVALLNRACAGTDNWNARTTVGVFDADPLACYHLGVLYATGGLGLPQNAYQAGAAFYNVGWVGRTSDTWSGGWYQFGNGLPRQIRAAAENGRQTNAPYLASPTPDDLWTVLGKFTAVLIAVKVVQKVTGIGDSPSPQTTTDAQREEARQQRAQRETTCIMLGGTWMPLAGICVF